MQLLCDAASTSTVLTRALGTSPQRRVQSIDLEHAGEQVRLVLRCVRTGLSLFGATVPPIDAWLLLRSAMHPQGGLTISWSIERLEGVPSMAASLVGKSTIAGFLLDALRKADARQVWNLGQALSADADGNLHLDPSRIEIPGLPTARLVDATIPGDAAHVLRLSLQA